MVNEELVYELQEDDTRNEMTFFFISKGETDIIKAIQYSLVQDLKRLKSTLKVRNLQNLNLQ